MLTKTNPDEIQSYLSDSSYIKSGQADRVLFPETADDVAEVLRAATRDKTPVTISGAGTGTVGGRVPTSGIILATDKLNQMKSIAHNREGGGSAVAEAGVRLADLQKFVDSERLFYPFDPTERSCFSAARWQPMLRARALSSMDQREKYVQRLKIALATGDIIDLRRGELHPEPSGEIKIPPRPGRAIEARLPTYQMPRTRKHAAGYYVAPQMD